MDTEKPIDAIIFTKNACLGKVAVVLLGCTRELYLQKSKKLAFEDKNCRGYLKTEWEKVLTDDCDGFSFTAEVFDSKDNLFNVVLVVSPLFFERENGLLGVRISFYSLDGLLYSESQKTEDSDPVPVETRESALTETMH